jgi:hypothetical protein
VADDSRVRWQLATPFGIEVDADSDAWHSGHVNDVIVFQDLSSILVATESGGVWLIDSATDPIALSNDWDLPDVKCLVLGPDGPRHMFAGCTVAYDSTEKRTFKQETGSAAVIMESDASALAPLLSWNPVNGALPATAGRITRMVVIPRLRRIVVSCAQVRSGDTGGIFWAQIPVTRFAPGDPPRPPFVWNQAKIPGPPAPQGFWDIAVAATKDDPSRDNLEDKRVITLVGGGYAAGGIFVGQWNDADDLIFKRSSVQFDDGSDATALLFDSCGTAAVSSCELHPTRLYATCAWPDGRLNAVLLSKDGGRNWAFCSATLAGGGPFDLLSATLGDQGKNWNNCISVHPRNPSIAALGWDLGPFLTFDAGSTWRRVDGGLHLHDDWHALRFSIEEPETIGFLYAGSDGGIAKINLDDLPGVNGPPVQSNFNRNLPTLQCYSMLYRQFTGSVDISAELSGILAAGLQDNGNVSCRFRPAAEPWHHVDQGDGGLNTSVRGGYLHNILSGASAATAPLSPDVQTKIVPITIPPPVDPSGLFPFVGEAVIEPAHRNAAGQLLVAVASAIGSNAVFGLHTIDEVVPPYEWQQLGALPAGQAVAGLASFSGDVILAGTAQGKIYALDTNTGNVVEQPMKLPKPSPSTRMAGGSIPRIVALDAGSFFAVLLGATETKADGTPPLGTPAVQAYVLQLEGSTWSPTIGAGLPNEFLYGFVAVTAPNTEVPRGLLAATDDAVYISRDDGKSWLRASMGLPRRPHCGDLRFAIDSLGGANIMLGTFGRSVWLANLAGGLP